MNNVVAIVIPVYNAQEYIADCLNSILAQTYPFLKVYCVDDGSTDNTPFILDDYAKKDNRILVFHIPNAGVSRARNYAISKIEDEDWVSFVDADDYLGASMYESIFKAIDNRDVDYVRLFSKKTFERYNPNIIVDRELKYKIVSCDDYFIIEPVGGYISSLFIKRNIVKENHILFPENMSILEDQVFSIKCAIYAQNLLVLEEPKDYYYYIGNEGSVTKKVRDNSDDIIRCINMVHSAFNKKGSLNIMNKYFYKKYLPLKLELLYKERIKFRTESVTVKLHPEIKKTFCNLSFKAKIYYLIVRLLKLL